jgi:hypothetical protein
MNSGSVALATKFFNAFNSHQLPLPIVMMNPFFLRAISYQIITRQDLERVLTLIRASCLETLIHGKQLNSDLRPLFYAVALQCQLNGYVFTASQDERNKLVQLVEQTKPLVQNVLTESQLSDQLVVISMYGNVHDYMEYSFTTSKLVLSKLFAKHVSQPYHVTYDTNITVTASEQVTNYYNNKLTIVHAEEPYITIPVHKEVEWSHPQQYWPKGFEQKEKVLIVTTSGYYDTSKYGDSVSIDQVCL